MYVTATSATDTFGHALHSLTKEEASARNVMQASQATKAKAWDAIDLSKIHPKKLKKMIREGVPKSLRRELWLDLSGGGTLREDFAKSHFLKLTSRPAPKPLIQDVEAGIFRYMPGHQYLGTPAGLHAVVSIVHAYMQHTNSRVQSNVICIAAFMVSVIGLDCVEDCFWILNGLLYNVLPATCTNKDLGPVPAECLVLGDLLCKRCPKLLAAFDAMDLSVSEITGRWFFHLFCGVLPAETTVRIWDCLMFEGVKVLFRVSLALLKRQESIVAGNVQKLRNIEWRVSRTFNADELLKMAFHGIGSLPIAVIKRSQENVEAQVQKDMLIHAQRLEALFCPPKISPPHSASSSMTELPTIPELA